MYCPRWYFSCGLHVYMHRLEELAYCLMGKNKSNIIYLTFLFDYLHINSFTAIDDDNRLLQTA